MKNLKIAIVIVAVIAALVFLVKADDINDTAGVVNIGDDVIYFTDEDGDGQFEKNAAKVVDDTRAAAALFNQPIQPGQRVNLLVFANGKSRTAIYNVFLVKRGRGLGQYEALATSNH